MNTETGYLNFIRNNAPFLATGALLSFLSSFGQTFFISIFGGEIREAYGLTNGDWGLIYMIGTGASAAAMVFAGGLADRFRVRRLGISVVLMLGLSCVLMALNPVSAILPFIIFCLRFFGQGMTTHVSSVAMARWFVATRGRALAIASIGFMLAEATLPLIMVWVKSYVDWRIIWVGCAIFCFAMTPILFRLLRVERTPQTMAGRDVIFRIWNRVLVSPSPLCRNQRLVAFGTGIYLSIGHSHVVYVYVCLWVVGGSVGRSAAIAVLPIALCRRVCAALVRANLGVDSMCCDFDGDRWRWAEHAIKCVLGRILRHQTSRVDQICHYCTRARRK